MSRVMGSVPPKVSDQVMDLERRLETQRQSIRQLQDENRRLTEALPPFPPHVAAKLAKQIEDVLSGRTALRADVREYRFAVRDDDRLGPLVYGQADPLPLAIRQVRVSW